MTPQTPEQPLFPVSVEQFAITIDALPDPIMVSFPRRDADGIVVDLEFRFVNAATLRLFGRREDEVVGHGHLEVFPSLRDTDLWQRCLAVLDSGETERIDVPWIEASGVQGSFAVAIVPFGEGLLISARDVTDYVRVVEQLRHERDLNNATLDVAGALIMLLDSDGRIVRFNRRCEQVTGFSEAELIGKSYEYLVLPDERTEVADILEPVQADRSAMQVNRIRVKDGEPRLLRWTNTDVLDAEGRRTHIVAAGLDITDQVRAEEQLRKERDLNTATLDVAAALIVLIDTDGRIVRFNRQSELLTGYREVDVVGRLYEFFIPVDERPAVAEAFEPRPDREIHRLNHYVTKDGELRLLRWSTASLLDADGNWTHTIIVGIDVTDQARAEEQLRHERDLNNAILDVAGAIIVVDAEGRIVRFNKQSEAIIGYREADIKGRFYDFFIPPSERDVVAGALLLSTPERPITQASHIITKQGTLRLIRWSEVPLADDDGNLTHMVVFGSDITDQQAAEEEVARRAAELAETNRELARAYADLERSTSVVSQLQAQAEERQRIAREVNDTIVQGLVAAESFYDLGRDEHARNVLRATSRQAREWVGQLLEGSQLRPGTARRHKAAHPHTGARHV